MFTFHIVAIPDVLYLFLYNLKGPFMEKISFFGPLCTEKNNESNRYCFSPKFVWVPVLGTNVRRKEER